MIKSATGLKANVRNISKGDDKVAKALIRIFFMERFLERVSMSEYRDQFILKGGMLVSSLLGINVRATMDIDTTVRALPLTEQDISRIVSEICAIEIEDRVSFQITYAETIMEDFDYPGIRLHMIGTLERLRQPIKIDVSTDDVITPRAIEYQYKLMFEERTILLNTYNIETLLAEKAQTIISRGLANTRMRDFYDLYEITGSKEFSWSIASDAFKATCRKRKTEFSNERIEDELKNITGSKELETLWNNFRKKNYFVGEIEYQDIIRQVSDAIRKIAVLLISDKTQIL